MQAGEISHAPWVWENAEAEFERDDLPGSFGFALPRRPPVLHYCAEVRMEAWTVRRLVQAGAGGLCAHSGSAGGLLL